MTTHDVLVIKLKAEKSLFFFLNTKFIRNININVF